MSRDPALPPGPPAPLPGARRRVALVSLGCPKNQVDGELILGRLQAEGAEIVDDPAQADTLVVNTCAFIDRAREESVGALLDAAAWKGAARGRHVIAAGCLVQRHGGELAAEMPELDALVGLDEVTTADRKILGLPALRAVPAGAATGLFTAADPRVRLGPAYSAFVKIAEGCDQNCAFCAIPNFRGRQRSRPVADVAAELRQLAREGVVEANLVAQDSTGYGRDLGLRDGLANLVRAIDAMDEAPPWVRVHYLYPGRISRGLVEALAGARRIVPYVDLPLQHADPVVLKKMNRPGNPDVYLRQLADLRAALPGAGVRSSFIVGFPGETDAQFEALCAFVGEAGFDSVGVFAYSHEEGTTAFGHEDDVPPELKEERRAALEEIAHAAAHARNLARVGLTLDVLVEGPAEDRPGLLAARWKGQAPEVDGRVLIERAPAGEAVAAPLPAPGRAPGLAPAPGTLARATIVDAEPLELLARLAG